MRRVPEAVRTEPSKPKDSGRGRLLTRVAAVVAVLAVIGVAWFFLRPQGRKNDETFTGYVVSQDVYMSSPVSGTLTSVTVKRGDRVAPGQPLFRIDPTVRAAQADQARAQISAAQAQVSQQQSALARARADLASAQADADRDEAEVRRLSGAQREKPGSVAQLQLDQSQASHRGALDKRDSARAQVQSAAAAIEAAQAQVRQADAGLTSAQRQLSDLAPSAPGAGRVEDVMFKPGESVAANAVVVSIVPDDEVKVRFYVPEALVNAYKPGRRVAIACDGCASGMTATVDFIANSPEYTPPVIYSLDARQKLVFMVEAVPSNPLALVPGQPMDVAATAADLKRR
jgi:HlyD family secretion protein